MCLKTIDFPNVIVQHGMSRAQIPHCEAPDIDSFLQ